MIAERFVQLPQPSTFAIGLPEMSTQSAFSSRLGTSSHMRQRGVVLLVSLLFLIVLTLLGVAASRMVTSEERQSRYLREYNTAFQASEAAMRDARDDIDGILATGASNPSPRITSKAYFSPTCDYGLCQYDQTEAVRPWTVDANWAKAINYGTYSLRSPLPKSQGGDAAVTGKDKFENDVDRVDLATNGTRSSSVTGVWKQPSYLIEAIRSYKAGTSEDVTEKTFAQTYRVTARGYGADPNSRATVQEIVCNPAACAGL
jgi:type IV pilus assembly protein PilX